MSYEIIAFLVGLSIIAFLRFGKGSLSRLTQLLPVSSNEDTSEKSGATKKFKGFMENEERFWLLGFIVVAVITILLYTVLDETKSDRWRIVGLITLVGMHVFIFWNFFRALLYKDKLHPATKFFVGACLIFWSIALFVPNFAQWMVTGTKNTVSDFDADFDPDAMAKGKVVQQSAPADNNTGSYVASQTLQVVPGERFKKVSIPPGRIIKDLTWDCPDGCILEIVHDGQPLCPATNIYQGLPCGSLQPDVGNGGATRNREQFAMPYGRFINFPRNIILISVAFGTDENLGPIEVTATVTI